MQKRGASQDLVRLLCGAKLVLEEMVEYQSRKSHSLFTKAAFVSQTPVSHFTHRKRVSDPTPSQDNVADEGEAERIPVSSPTHYNTTVHHYQQASYNRQTPIIFQREHSATQRADAGVSSPVQKIDIIVAPAVQIESPSTIQVKSPGHSSPIPQHPVQEETPTPPRTRESYDEYFKDQQVLRVLPPPQHTRLIRLISANYKITHLSARFPLPQSAGCGTLEVASLFDFRSQFLISFL